MGKHTIRLIERKEGPSFEGFIQHEPYRSILAGRRAFKGILLPIGLFDEGSPQAILLGHIPLGHESCLLAGLGALAELAGQGWERRMESFLCDKCLAGGVRDIRFLYDSDSPGASAINQLLDECGYSPSRPELLICRCDRKLSELALLAYTDLPPGFETLGWLETKPEQRQALGRHLETAPWFEPRLSPFLDDEHISPEPSLALLRNGEIVGWAVCHQTEPDTIDYTTLEVFPEYQGVGTGIALQMRSIRKHLLSELGERVPYGRFVVNYKDQARLRVLKRKFLPHAADWHDRMLRQKNLTKD